MSAHESWSPEPFRPAWFAKGHHGQTFGARLLRPEGDVPFRRERVDTPDGDFIDLDFPYPDESHAVEKVVVLFHGLEGSARSKYALETYRQLQRRGISAVGMNFRSCSGEINRVARLYHSGETADVAFILDLVRDRFPDARLGAAGFSLGGNALLKYLGERGDRAVPEAATAVSVPFDLGAGSDNLERPGGRVYLAFLLRKLRRKTKLKADILRDLVDVEAAVTARTFREFDDAATAPLHGFRDAQDYYDQCSSAQFIPGIRVPTFLFHSFDDPFLPAACVPVDAVQDNPQVSAEFTDGGGHVGFLEGSMRRPSFWAERQVARYFAHRFGD